MELTTQMIPLHTREQTASIMTADIVREVDGHGATYPGKVYPIVQCGNEYSATNNRLPRMGASVRAEDDCRGWILTSAVVVKNIMFGTGGPGQ